MTELDLNRLYPLPEAVACGHIPMHRKAAERYCRTGQIRAVKIAGRWYIPGREIARIHTEGTDPVGGRG